MARKQSTLPGQTPEDIYTLKLPGGVAKMWRTIDLPASRSRELDVYRFSLMPRISEAVNSAVVKINGVVVEEPTTDQQFQAAVVDLTRDEVRDFFEMNDLAAVVYLKSWTVKRNGEPAPLPATTDELRDLPRNLYDPLVQRAAEIFRTDLGDDFTVAHVEDPASPTGAFDA